ncbi:MAG: hypothetical protein AB1545_07295, partial [Thermodesulfobacteriota bacterium]
MIKRTTILMTTAFMFVTLPGAAVAGDQDRDQKQLKDGSCLPYSTDVSGSFNLAGDRDQDRTKDQDKLKDGSCLDYSTGAAGGFIVADDKDRLRDGTGDGIPDRLRDGSCLDYSTDVSGVFTLAGDELRDGTGD